MHGSCSLKPSLETDFVVLVALYRCVIGTEKSHVFGRFAGLASHFCCGFWMLHSTRPEPMSAGAMDDWAAGMDFSREMMGKQVNLHPLR